MLVSILVKLGYSMELEYKTYGYVRLFLYVVAGIGSVLVGSVVLLSIARVLPLLRLLGRELWLDVILISVLGIVGGFWLINYWLIAPLFTKIDQMGFSLKPPNQFKKQVAVNWSRLEKVSNLGFGTYVKAYGVDGKSYRFIFCLDTDDYARLIDTIRSNYQRYQYSRWRGK